MRSLLSAATALLLTALCIAGAGEEPTIEQVAANPAKFEGKTLVFKGVQVSDKVFEGPKQVRLTVKTKGGTVVESKLSKGGITFVIAKEKAAEMTKSLKPEEFNPATLTCKIEKTDKGFWLAKVQTFDLSTAKDTTVKKNKKKGNDQKEKTAVVDAEGAGKTHDDALKDAFRHAVRQVVGAMVDAETVIKNDQVISDKVLTYSAGIVKKYEEVSKTKEKGLIRVKIKATVEQKEMVARLNAAKVTIKDVDGKGLFARAVTTINAIEEGRALLSEKLRKYRAHIVQAEPVGKPQVKKAGKDETTIEYEVRLSARPKTYGSPSRPMSFSASEFLPKVPEDYQGLVICTQRTRLNDRLTWERFLVPKMDDISAAVQVHISLVDKEEKEISSNDIPFSLTDLPGWHEPPFMRTLILAPYLIDSSDKGNERYSIAPDLVIKVISTVATSDLKFIKGVQCKIEVKEKVGKSD